MSAVEKVNQILDVTRLPSKTSARILPKHKFLIYLDHDGCLSHSNKVHPLNFASKPALQENNFLHDILVQDVLKLLPFKLFEIHL